MVKTEFWYSEVGSRAEGRNKSTRESKRWWLPLPRVPEAGLSETARNKLLCKAKVVLQVFKAAKAINESVLLEMPVPHIIKDALPKVSLQHHLQHTRVPYKKLFLVIYMNEELYS